MKTKTNIKSAAYNHNETFVRPGTKRSLKGAHQHQGGWIGDH